MDQQTLIEAALIPTGAALLAAAVLFVLSRGKPERRGIAALGVLVVPAAYLTGHLYHFTQPPWTNWQAVDAWQWIAPGVGIAATFGIASVLVNRGWLTFLLRLIVTTALTCITLQSYIRFTWTMGESAGWIVGISLGGVLWWTAVEYAGRRPAGNWFAVQWLLLTIGCAAIFILSKSARLAEICMMLGAGIGSAMVLQIAGRRSIAAGMLAIAPLVLLALWINGYFYAELTWWRALVPAVAPICGLIAATPVLQQKRKWLGPLLATLAILAIVAAVVGVAAATYEVDPYGGGY